MFLYNALFYLLLKINGLKWKKITHASHPNKIVMFIRDIFIPYDSEESFPAMLSAISPLLQDLKHGLTHNNCTSTAQAPVNDIPLTEKNIGPFIKFLYIHHLSLRIGPNDGGLPF